VLIPVFLSSLLTLLGSPAPPPAAGQASSLALYQRLAKATGLTCTFSQLVTATWTAGVAGAKVAPAQVKVTFSNINTDEGSAEADSRFGGAPIIVKAVNGYMHLMQMYGAGPLYTTTVIAKETTRGRLRAVHTRHEHADVTLPGFTSNPEMYLGDCAIVP